MKFGFIFKNVGLVMVQLLMVVLQVNIDKCIMEIEILQNIQSILYILVIDDCCKKIRYYKKYDM